MSYARLLVNKMLTNGPRCVLMRFNSQQSNIARLCNLAKHRGLYSEKLERNLQAMDPKRFQQLMEENNYSIDANI